VFAVQELSRGDIIGYYSRRVLDEFRIAHEYTRTHTHIVISVQSMPQRVVTAACHGTIPVTAPFVA